MTSRRIALGLLLLAGSVAAQEPEPEPEAIPRLGQQQLFGPVTELPAGPLPEGLRYVFDRDSILWSQAATLSDLLSQVPGVYVVRTGFLGVPEYISYGGRGAAAVELYWDGVRVQPLGPDSLYIDPSTYPLTYLDRVEVVALPATLRVYLLSAVHNDLEPKSTVNVVTGGFGLGSYAGLFQKRWRNGLGLSVAADLLTTDGASGPNRSDQLSDVWTRLDWVRDSVAGISFSFRRQSIESDPVTSVDSDVGVLARDGDRTDWALQLFARNGGTGPFLSTTVGGGGWSDSLLPDQRFRFAQAVAGYRGTRFNAVLSARTGNRFLRSEQKLDVGWSPATFLHFSGSARQQEFGGDRTTRDVSLTATIDFGVIYAGGVLSRGELLQAPMVVSDTVQDFDDMAGWVGLRIPLLSGRVGVTTRDAFEPAAFPLVPLFGALAPTPRIEYVEAEARLGFDFLNLAGWYSTPRDDSRAAFVPPTLSKVSFTLRSKFWRTFRSGAFDFLLQLSMEAWSTGVAGLDPSGAPVVLAGANFYNSLIEFRLVEFTAFWQLRNAFNSRGEYVPGLRYPSSGQRWGVRWTFGD